MSQDKKTFFVIVLSTCALTLTIFRSLLAQLTTGLLDWYDYPYYVWTMYQNISKLAALNFSDFFSTNAFYPLKDTLLFSDLLLPQSIIGLMFSFFSSNPILVFNLTFFTTLFLNNIASYYLWKNIFTKKTVLWFVCMVTSAFPFLFLQIGHFQMITMWPMYFGLGILFKKSLSYKWGIALGLIITLQFLASVYLAVFLLTMIAIWGVVSFLTADNTRKKQLFIFTVMSAVVFTITSGPILSSYLKIKNAYGITRSYGEYVLYAAQPTDYLFNNVYSSALSKTQLFQKINNYNLHSSGERMGSTGISLTLLVLIGAVLIKQTKNELQIIFPKSTLKIIFFSAIIVGFLFSLGPKLTINGSFTSLPLPYVIFLKTVPLFEPIRATGRWALIFYLGIIYFAGIGLTKILKRTKVHEYVIVGLLFGLYCYEVVSFTTTVKKKEYYNSAYQAIEQICQQQKTVLLEYPLSQDTADVNVATNLSYRTTQLLANIHHKCYLINGYAGYDPDDYLRFEHELTKAVNEMDEVSFKKLINQRGVSLFKLNKQELFQEKVEFALTLLQSYPNLKVLSNTKESIVVSLN